MTSMIKTNERDKSEVANLPSKYNYIKRFLDVFLTFLASPLILILIVIFGILVFIESEGPAFYTQERVGKNGKIFVIYKLRSMRINAESASGAVWAEKDDPRITRVGKFIRKVRIDELPQFLNVIKGDMSIIGPRPEREDLTNKFNEEIIGFKRRLQVKPGITGLAQVNGGYDISPEEKLKYDLDYISNFSMKQDISIFFKTIRVVLTGDGAR